MTVREDVIRAIEADYGRRTPGSRALHERARTLLPGGVSGNLRHFAPWPLYMRAASGAHCEDVDGNDYVDCFMGNGPMLLGHRPPEVMAALEEHRQSGSLTLNPELLVECAARFCALVPCAERVRFLNSGTEAVMTALRCARAFTGRTRIVRFHGHYHGQHDAMLFGVGPDASPISAGLPAAVTQDTTLLPWLELDRLEAELRRGDVAAVLLDASMHAGGLWPADPEALQNARLLAEAHGTLFVLDEVITGFRLSPGGAQAHFGVVPDLATFGKALAAGEKLSAVAGRAEVLAVLDPEAPPGTPRVFQSGTSNDGTGGLASACGALRAYETRAADGSYERLAGLTARLADGLVTLFARHGVPCHANRLGSMVQLFQSDAAPDFAHYATLDRTLVRHLYLALLVEGSMLSLPSSDHVYLSFAHSDADVDLVLAAAGRCFERYELAALAAPTPTR